MKKLFVISVFVILVAFLFPQAQAEVPHMINYQGKLTTNTGFLVNDTIQMVFSICDQIGNTYWIETDTVEVLMGVFNVILGMKSPIPDSVFNEAIRYLKVTVGGEEILPWKRIASVGYAYMSIKSDTADYARLAPATDSARVAGNAHKLQGKDTTDLDSRYVNEGQVNAVNSGMIQDNAIVRADVVSNFKAPYSDTADYARVGSGIKGSGTTNYISKFTDSTTIGNSEIYQTASGNIGIGTTNPTAKLEVDTTIGTAIIGKSVGGSGTKYGGLFFALTDGSNNIGIRTWAGCTSLPCTPGSSSNIGIFAISSRGYTPMQPSGDWAGYFYGKVKITDTLEVNAPIRFDFDYDSGWRAISAGGTLTLTHGLEGDASKYVVFLTGKASDGTIHNQNYGMDCAAGLCYGAYWKGLTNQQIIVERKAQDGSTAPDGDWAYVMVRILKNQ